MRALLGKDRRVKNKVALGALFILLLSQIAASRAELDSSSPTEPTPAATWVLMDANFVQRN